MNSLATILLLLLVVIVVVALMRTMGAGRRPLDPGTRPVSTQRVVEREVERPPASSDGVVEREVIERDVQDPNAL